MFSLKQALLDIKYQKRFSLIFTTNLLIGLIGLIFLLTLNTSLSHVLGNKSKELLGADFALTARRLINADELKDIESNFESKQVSRSLRLFTMAKTKDLAKLIRLRGIDSLYPLIGDVYFQDQVKLNEELKKDIVENPHIWIYPELAAQFRVKLGDNLKIGDLSFKITKIIEKDSSDASSGVSLAPRAYVSLTQLYQTNLVSKFSTLRDTRYYILGSNEDPYTLKEKLLNTVKDNTIKFRTPKDASEQVTRALDRLFDYLGLLMLVALFICFIGCHYLFRSYLQKNINNLALYKILGLQTPGIAKILIIKVLLLSFFSWVVAQTIAYASFFPLQALLSDLMQIEFEPILTTKIIIIGLLIALLGPLFFLLSYIVQYAQIKPNSLLDGPPSEKLSIVKRLSLSLPAVIFIIILGIFLANSYKVAGLFMIGMLASLFLLSLIGAGLFQFTKKINFKSPLSNLSLKNISRDTSGSLTLFLSIGLATILIILIPQVQTSLQTELKAPSKDHIPQLFLFDIQEEQLDPLQSELTKLGSKLTDISPMVRARLVKVNGEDFERDPESESFTTREDQRERHFRNRGLNLSYSYNGLPQHNIVKGRQFSGIYDWESDKPMEVSIEKRFAKRLGLKVEDILTMDIQGLEIQATLVNTRTVDWLSFKPNFFVEMQPGSVNDAPKTFIGVLTGLEEKAKNIIQFELSQAFPSISMVDITRTIQEILRIVTQLQYILIFVALISVVVGLFVIFSIGQFEGHKHIKEYNLLKVLGSVNKDILMIFVGQFSFILIPAILSGVVISYLLAYIVNQFILEISPMYLYWPVPVFFFTTLSFMLLITYFAIMKILKQKPAEILNES